MQSPARNLLRKSSRQLDASSVRHPETTICGPVPLTPGANVTRQHQPFPARHTYRSLPWLRTPHHRNRLPSPVDEQRTTAAVTTPPPVTDGRRASELSPLCQLSDARASRSVEATRSKVPPSSSTIIGDGGASERCDDMLGGPCSVLFTTCTPRFEIYCVCACLFSCCINLGAPSFPSTLSGSQHRVFILYDALEAIMENRLAHRRKDLVRFKTAQLVRTKKST